MKTSLEIYFFLFSRPVSFIPLVRQCIFLRISVIRFFLSSFFNFQCNSVLNSFIYLKYERATVFFFLILLSQYHGPLFCCSFFFSLFNLPFFHPFRPFHSFFTCLLKPVPLIRSQYFISYSILMYVCVSLSFCLSVSVLVFCCEKKGRCYLGSVVW